MQWFDGLWVVVDFVFGGLVVNLGDAMVWWMNDCWCSTMHRVVVFDGGVMERGERC